MITINGQFTARRMTGQERFAYETVSELDKICQKGDYELVVPKDAINIPDLQNIEVKRFGKLKGSSWEQIFLNLYLLSHRNRTSLNLCSIMPILAPGIVCIHDLSYKIHPEYITTLYSKISQIWHKIQFHLSWNFSPLILTVSEYSKKQMETIYKVSGYKILVLGNGWEHFKRIKEDNSFLESNHLLEEKPFFFSLGSLAPNKNIKWVLEVAKKHPQYNFFIAGNSNLRAYGEDYKDIDFVNVKFLGYISDADVKCLMKHCKAFIFPSFFEGFGIPPLEALSVGTKCIVAKTSCLPEIFGDSVYWIDPYDTNINIDNLLAIEVTDSKFVLNKYLFSRFANTLHSKLKELNYI